MKRALIVVDPQYDFMPGGALPVSGGDEIVPAVNRLLSVPWDLVVVSQDWHPADHCSFRDNGGTWPAHCVPGTQGSRVHGGVSWHKPWTLVRKGCETDRDSYSAFNAHPDIAELLGNLSISSVYVCGLATDYCVKATVIDALAEAYETHLVLDACRAVSSDGGPRAVAAMVEAGAKVTTVRRMIE